MVDNHNGRGFFLAVIACIIIICLYFSFLFKPTHIPIVVTFIALCALCCIYWINKKHYNSQGKFPIIAFRLIVVVVAAVNLFYGGFFYAADYSDLVTQKIKETKEKLSNSDKELSKLDAFNKSWTEHRIVLINEINEINNDIKVESNRIQTDLVKYNESFQIDQIANNEKRRGKLNENLHEYETELSNVKDIAVGNIKKTHEKKIKAIEDKIEALGTKLDEKNFTDIIDEPPKTLLQPSNQDSVSIDKKTTSIGEQEKPRITKLDIQKNNKFITIKKLIQKLTKELETLNNPDNKKTIDTINKEIAKQTTVLTTSKNKKDEQIKSDLEKEFKIKEETYNKNITHLTHILNSYYQDQSTKSKILKTGDERWLTLEETRAAFNSEHKNATELLTEITSASSKTSDSTVLLIKALCLGCLGALVSFLLVEKEMNSQWEYLHELSRTLLVGAIVSTAGYALLAAGQLSVIVSNTEMNIGKPDPFRQVFFCLILGAFADRFYNWARKEIDKRQISNEDTNKMKGKFRIKR